MTLLTTLICLHRRASLAYAGRDFVCFNDDVEVDAERFEMAFTATDLVGLGYPQLEEVTRPLGLTSYVRRALHH